MDNPRTVQRRAQILSAALDAFSENGYQKTRIADIALRLSMGHGTFYRYFRNKLDIFDSVLDLVIEKLAAVMTVEDPRSTNTADEYRRQIERIGARLYKTFIRDTRLAQIVFYEALGVDPELNEKVDGVMEMIHQGIEEYLKNGMDKGFLQPDLDAPVLARAITAMMFAGAKDLLATEGREARSSRWTTAIARFMLRGMEQREP